MHRGPDPPAFQRGIASSLVPGDEQHNPFPRRDRAFERPVDFLPRAVETVAVQIERSVGLDLARGQPPVPATIKGRLVEILGPLSR